MLAKTKHTKARTGVEVAASVGQWAPLKRTVPGSYLGGVSFSSKNSSILFTSVFTSPSKVMKGGFVPGARFCRSAGFLEEAKVHVVSSIWATVHSELDPKRLQPPYTHTSRETEG